jgi:glycosyltransferase involved in cell wall biosynthesis
MRKLKILIVAPFPPPFGGIARYAEDLWTSEELNREFELYRLNNAKGEGFLHGEGRSDRTWQRGLYFLKPMNWGFLFYLMFNYLEYVYKLIKIRPDIVHVHTCSYFGFIRSGFFLFLARPFRCRRILHLHNAVDAFFEENKNSRFFKRLITWSMNQANEYVVLSEGLRVWVEENIAKKAFVIWNACYSRNYLPQENDRATFLKNFPQAQGKIVVLLVGGLYPNKGAFDLLEVIANLTTQEREKLLFILPGKGERTRAEAFIAERHLEESVLIPGVISEEVKNNLVRNSDIFTLPSYAEGQPIAILEAMSASLPIVSTHVGSIAEVVEDGKIGYLITPGDLTSLKNFILRLADNPALRVSMGKAARQRIDERHDINCLFESTARLYRERRYS